MFHGPPGTGKTHLAKIVASQVNNAAFYNIRGPELSYELRGGTARKLRDIFEHAKDNSPALIFFDEIDSIAPRRDQSQESGRQPVGQLLSLMDGLEDRGQVVVIGATNLIDEIDPALRRPGRFGREIKFSRPSEKERKQLFDLYKPEISFNSRISFEALASRSNGWSGAHIKSFFEQIAEILILERRDKGKQPEVYPMDIDRAFNRIQDQVDNIERQQRREKEISEKHQNNA
nr:AAA family ATPase [Natronococcus jeotgali]